MTFRKGILIALLAALACGSVHAEARIVGTSNFTYRAVSENYYFDDEGLRTKVVIGTLTKYNVYNESRQLVAQYEKVGTAATAWKKSIVYVGTKEVAEISSTGTSITLVDHLGSPRWLWSGSGAPVMQKFLPYGETFADSVTAAKFSKGFTNHEQTDASGLIYMQARFYVPWYGRFLSPDSKYDEHFQDTQGWNIYSYVQNQPTMLFDPDGMQAQRSTTEKVIDFVDRFGGGFVVRGINNLSLNVPQYAHDAFGIGPAPPSPSIPGTLGALTADAAGIAFGVVETTGGVTGGLATAPSGVGPVVGGAVAVHGISVVGTSTYNMVMDAKALMAMVASTSAPGGSSGQKRDASDAPQEKRSEGPAFKTDKEAKAQAEKLGYKPTKERSQGAQVFKKGGKGEGPNFITRDRDSHNGGAFKGASKAKDLGSKETRSGTYDKQLKRIGD
jgi:RHS repeat-associated protein